MTIMRSDSLGMLLQRGKEQYECLHVAASELLQNFESLGPEVMARAISRRQEFIDEIENIEKALADYAKIDKGGYIRKALEEFTKIQESAIREILKIDSLVIALARERLATMKEKLQSLATGKAALNGYERSNRFFQRKMEKSA
jgi:hypothetical protein